MLIGIISLLSVIFLFDLVISYLNYRHRNTPIPAIASDIYDATKYQKWLSYFMVNHRFQLLTKTIDFFVLIVLLILGFPSLVSLSNQWFTDPLLSSLSFLGLYVLIDLVLGLPFALYQTFHIEAKFGFNKTTYKQFIIDKIKGLLLTLILGGAIVSLLYWLYTSLGWWFILGAWIFLSVLIILLFILNTKVFVRLFNKLTPLEEGELKTRINELSTRLGFQINNISVMDASKRSTKLNAFFSGFGKFKDVVLYDTLINAMSTDQILAVLAHELGHSKHKDTLRSLSFQVAFFGVFAGLLYLVLGNMDLANAFGLNDLHFGFSLILFLILMSPVNLIVSIPMNYFSRKAEFRADAMGAHAMGKIAISGALKVLSQENLSNLTPHPWYVFLYYSHPSTPVRLTAIDAIKLP